MDVSLWYFSRLRHHTRGPVASIVAYLDWLNHRNPSWPYWLRRLRMPSGVMIVLLEQLLAHQETVLARSFDIPLTVEEPHLKQQDDALDALERTQSLGSIQLPLMRVFRLHSTLVKQRQRFFNDLEMTSGEDLGANTLLEIHVNLRNLLGIPRILPARRLRELYRRQVNLERSLNLLYEGGGRN